MKPESFESNRAKAIIEGPEGTIKYFEEVFTKLGFIVTSERLTDDSVQLRLKDEFGDVITDERSYEIALNTFTLDQGKYDRGSSQLPTMQFDENGEPYLAIRAVA